MNIMKYSGITDKVLLVITVFIALFLYSASFSPKQTKKRLRIFLFILCVAGILGICVLTEYLKFIISDAEYVITLYKNGCDILYIVLCIASMCVIKELSFKNVLFIGCAAVATSNCANCLYSLVCSFIIRPGVVLTVPAELAVRLTVFLLLYAAVYAVFWFAFARRYKASGEEYAINNVGYLLFIMCFVANLFMVNVDDLIMQIVLVGRILTNVLIEFFLFYQSKYLNLQEENFRLQYIMEQQKQQFKIAKENIEQINVKVHDLKHIIKLLKENKEVSDEFTSQISELCCSYENFYMTGNNALDVTLGDKCKDFADKKITSSIIADGSAISFMSDIDIYILFGNLIDNAKEAMLNIADENCRIFNMTLKRKEEIVQLHIENTFFRKPEFSGGLPITCKEDKLNHGFGVKSIKKIVEKYGGLLKMYCGEKLFAVDIVFFK